MASLSPTFEKCASIVDGKMASLLLFRVDGSKWIFLVIKGFQPADGGIQNLRSEIASPKNDDFSL